MSRRPAVPSRPLRVCVCSGTFSKKSAVIGPRRPFAMDTEVFNYDYDSGADWEDEGEGNAERPAVVEAHDAVCV